MKGTNGWDGNPGEPAAATASPWAGFTTGLWQKEINVRDFIQQNYEPYDGDASFLAGATARTAKIWDRLNELFVEERKKGVLDISQIPSSITAHEPGYIDRENEIIVGLQTDAPLKRAIMPNGGLRMVLNALKAYGYEPDPHVVEAFTKYRKTHNDGGLRRLHRRRAAMPQLTHPDRVARRVRARPDHRRLPAGRALRRRPSRSSGSRKRRVALDSAMSTDEVIRDREELAEQIRALKELQKMAVSVRVRHLGPGEQPRRKPCSGCTSAIWPA